MDKALKQRLVGASVLIVLAVVVLPMLLGGQPQNGQETRSIDVPSKPSELLGFETRRFPLGQQEADQLSTVPENEQTATPPETVRQTEPPVRKTPEEKEDPPADDSGSAGQAMAGSDEQAQPGRYLVQVASFSTTANANRLAGRLRDDGLAVLVDTIDSNVGRLHRVRVGPFDRIEGTNEALALIKARTPDVNPRVIDLRPDESAPVTDPADPLARWIVQVGSFSEQKNAEKLVGQLRAAGFNAFNVTVTGLGTIRYKVRVGPEIERQSAVQIAGEIRDRLELDGIVMIAD